MMRTNHRWPLRALFSLLAVFLFAFSACDNEENDPLTDSLSGKWVLESVSGGFSGNGYDPGFTTLYFVNATEYRLLKGDSLLTKGAYSLFKKDQEDWIEFNPNPISSFVLPFEDPDKKVEVHASHLVLSDPCCDLFEYHFDKEKN